jgi:hypothetical protein
MILREEGKIGKRWGRVVADDPTVRGLGNVYSSQSAARRQTIGANFHPIGLENGPWRIDGNVGMPVQGANLYI